MCMWPRFPPVLPLPISAGLGSLSSTALRFLGSDRKVCQKFKEKVFYQGNLCYHGIDERIRLQEQKLWAIFPGPRGPKNQFRPWWPNLAHNLNLIVNSFPQINPIVRI